MKNCSQTGENRGRQWSSAGQILPKLYKNQFAPDLRPGSHMESSQHCQTHQLVESFLPFPKTQPRLSPLGLVILCSSTQILATPLAICISLHVPAPPDCDLSSFCALSVDDVIDAIRKLPVKQCATDPLPTHLLKDNVDVLAPFITELFNRSLSSGVFPTQFKAAHITPCITKKAGSGPF